MKKLEMVLLFKKLQIGRFFIHGDSFKHYKDDVIGYIKLIVVGVGLLLISPLALIYLLWMIRPRFYWFNGDMKEVQEYYIKKEKSRQMVEGFKKSIS